MKLVNEDHSGAYLGVTAEFKEKFICRETNPNFDVFDSSDNNNRFMAVKSSRLPDDEDIEAGRFGIDFNRAKPDLNQALRYGSELPQGYQWIRGVAFATKTEAEYAAKAAVWDLFYDYIRDGTPRTLWAAPHSGKINRLPDDVMRFPDLMIDAFTAGVAARCAFNDRRRVSRPILMAVHSTGHLGGVLNLGDFGIDNSERLNDVGARLELKYGERAQTLASEFIEDFRRRTIEVLDSMYHKYGTVAPDRLAEVSYDDSLAVRYYEKGLRLYGQEIGVYTPDEFEKAIDRLREIRVPVVTSNYYYTGRNVGRQLGLPERIAGGELGGAIMIECSRLYAARDPGLVSDIILDLRDGLWG